MSGKFSMDDYVPVNERIDQFYRSHPEGSIQSEIVELTASRVTVKAYAYRTPDDPRPGVGHSSLEIPGSTPYTRGSEIENCETSAWGRAIAALGFEVRRGVASREEVRNKQPERAAGGAPASSPNRPSAQASRSPEEERLRDELLALTNGRGREYLEHLASTVGVPGGQRATAAQLGAMIDLALSEAANEPPESAPLAEEASEVGSPPADPDALPPRPQTPEYGALTPAEKAKARAYWAEHAEPDPTLAEQLQVPA